MEEEEQPVYLESCREDLMVPMYNMDKELAKYTKQEIKEAMHQYTWTEGDVLLCIYAKCGTHLVWEITQMLMNGRAEYMDVPKESLMIDLAPATYGANNVPSPKALNTHYRLDVLPDQFQNRKTIFVLRNVKDYFVSDYLHMEGYWKMIKAQDPAYVFPLTMEQFIDSVLEAKQQGNKGTMSYFEFHEHMIPRRNDENILFLVFEEMIRDTPGHIRKIDAFLEAGASEELMTQVAEAVNFQKLKAAKAHTERMADSQLIKEEVDKKIGEKERFTLYRRGKIGGWKDYITVAQNERIDAKLKDWIEKNGFHGIPFIYE